MDNLKPNPVQRISDTLEKLNDRIARIHERLDAVAEAYAAEHRDEYEWQLHKRMAGHVGYTDNAHAYDVIVSIFDVEGQPITRRAAVVQSRSGVSFNFASNPISATAIGSIEVTIDEH